MEDLRKVNSLARVANKFRLASTITAIQTVKTAVAQVITATKMELLAQTIMSHQLFYKMESQFSQSGKVIILRQLANGVHG